MTIQQIAVVLAGVGGLGSILLYLARLLIRRGRPSEVQVRYTGRDGRERLLLAGGSDVVVDDTTRTLRSMPPEGDRNDIVNEMEALVDRQAHRPAIEALRPRRELPGKQE